MHHIDVLQIVLVVFMTGALGAVILGVIVMAVNGNLNKNHSHKLMRLAFYFRQLLFLCLL